MWRRVADEQQPRPFRRSTVPTGPVGQQIYAALPVSHRTSDERAGLRIIFGADSFRDQCFIGLRSNGRGGIGLLQRPHRGGGSQWVSFGETKRITWTRLVRLAAAQVVATFVVRDAVADAVRDGGLGKEGKK